MSDETNRMAEWMRLNKGPRDVVKRYMTLTCGARREFIMMHPKMDFTGVIEEFPRLLDYGMVR